MDLCSSEKLKPLEQQLMISWTACYSQAFRLNLTKATREPSTSNASYAHLAEWLALNIRVPRQRPLPLPLTDNCICTL
jgi:hypothetical protein